LIGGFMQAHDRFLIAHGDRFNHLPTYYAIFESLAWTYSIDMRLNQPNQPELRGLRHVRNQVHHQWARALWLDRGGELPLVLGESKLDMVSEWRWVNSLGRRGPGRHHADKLAYAQHLAMRPARETLAALRAYLAPMVTPESLGS
jgi:hypothetical protein